MIKMWITGVDVDNRGQQDRVAAVLSVP